MLPGLELTRNGATREVEDLILRTSIGGLSYLPLVDLQHSAGADGGSTLEGDGVALRAVSQDVER